MQQTSWRRLMAEAYRALLNTLPPGTIPPEHLNDTPARVTNALGEFFKGSWEDPKEVLSTTFPWTGDEMVLVTEIDFVSFCAHHLLPFWGKVHFAYIPKGHLVGLSKIPRLVEVLSARPQVQEKLANDIVDTFSGVVSVDCAVMIEAFHTCMAVRGVKKKAVTRTTALRGEFRSFPHVKEEFLQSIRSTLVL